MASCHNDNDLVHLRSSSCSCLSDKNHCRSKAQMCLKKILDFISFHSSKKSQGMRIESGFCNDIDLNLRLGGNDLEYDSKDVLSACSGVGEDKSPQRECGVQKESSESRVGVEVEHPEEESSEITHLQDEEHSNKVKNGKRKVVEEQRQSKGYLDLLVEAARLVSAGDERVKKPSQTQCDSINETVPPVADTNWFDCYGGIEVDMSPLVRSKRGRNQVLPSRFRDSVLEPLRRVSTTPKSSRLSAAKQKSRK